MPLKRINISNRISWLVERMPLFAFVNLVPLSVLAAPFGIFAIYSKRSLTILSIIWPLVIYTLYTIISTLAYNPDSFLEFAFYRTDGNFFITLLVLLSVITFARDANTEQMLRALCVFAALSFIVMWPIDTFINHNEHFFGLFKAHNAAGGFYAIICIISWHFFSGRTRILIVLTLFLATIETGSRGSLLALIIVATIGFLKFNTVLRWLTFFIFLSLTVQIAFNAVQKFGPATEALFQQEHSESAQEINKSNPDASNFAYGNNYNIFIRVGVLWPRAVRIWKEHPVLGAGFGSYDDLHYVGRNNTLYADTYLVQHTFSHAHHTFLNVLAEQGVVGLILLLISLLYIDRTVRSLDDPLGKAASLSLLILMFMSLSEHRLFSPSNSIPVMYITGLALVRFYIQKKERRIS